MPHSELPDRPEMLMPVSEDKAALQFFIEALKQNTEVIKRVGKTMEGLQAEQKETLQLVHDTRERVIRMESGGHAETVADLERKIDELEGEVDDLRSDRDKRDGAASLATWFFRNWPGVIGFLALVVLFLQSDKLP